jgi:hypothetical protein
MCWTVGDTWHDVSRSCEEKPLLKNSSSLKEKLFQGGKNKHRLLTPDLAYILFYDLQDCRKKFLACIRAGTSLNGI